MKNGLECKANSNYLIDEELQENEFSFTFYPGIIFVTL